MLVEVKDLTRKYVMGETEVHALRGVSLSVERGEFVAIMGPSGSGKSTLMHLLGCLDRPTTGTYRLGGTPVEKLTDQELSRLRNRKVGFVFQTFNLIAQLNVMENVEVPLIYMGLESAKRQRLCAEVLEAVGLGHRGTHRPNELSGGENQRVAIARALVTSPDIILADEPTGNLDTKTGNEIMEILRDLNERGTTIVLVTHEISKAKWARRIIHMQDGRILRELTGGQIQQLVDLFQDLPQA
ncbi:MAG: ABC transporter ATP-binding protein [candidate division KSB1 bacterium]|nr:ABC transporter ATP-binding protein [candidate division KSB1 bacterium]MDZ7367446.1 ABC transporter ATP-binding protein [candidate division KSB1 bacterium]MDZ7405449.1 ABC transporter ATP-binding protein [candidate division KSB1 bacterium]